MSARVGLDKAGLELSHIEQIGDEPVEALRLLEKSREKLGLALIGQLAREALEHLRRADDRSKRRPQIVRNGRKKSRAEAVGLDPAFGLIEVVDERHPLDGKCRLIHQRIEQTALVGS